MAMITSSEYGIVAVNNTVLCKMIIDDMLSMSASLTPCNKRGKALRKGFFTGYNEFYNAVELSDDPDGVRIRVYFVVPEEAGAQAVADALFDMIEADFEMLCLDMPVQITADIKGVQQGRTIQPLELEAVRRHDY